MYALPQIPQNPDSITDIAQRIRQHLVAEPGWMLRYYDRIQRDLYKPVVPFQQILYWRARRSYYAILLFLERYDMRGLIALDPMCGSGTIPWALATADNIVFGGDIEPAPLAYQWFNYLPEHQAPLRFRADAICPHCRTPAKSGDLRGIIRWQERRCPRCGRLRPGIDIASNMLGELGVCAACGRAGWTQVCKCGAVFRLPAHRKKPCICGDTSPKKQMRRTGISHYFYIMTCRMCHRHYASPAPPKIHHEIARLARRKLRERNLPETLVNIILARFERGVPSTSNLLDDNPTGRQNWDIDFYWHPAFEDFPMTRVNWIIDFVQSHAAEGHPLPMWYSADARNLPFMDGTFDLVFTDPPYHDTFDYSKLAASRASGQADSASTFIPLMREIWRECYRVTCPSGLLCFTYQDIVKDGWIALQRSIENTGWHLLGLAIYPGERQGSPRRAATMDCILVYSKQSWPRYAINVEDVWAKILCAVPRPNQHDRAVVKLASQFVAGTLC